MYKILVFLLVTSVCSAQEPELDIRKQIIDSKTFICFTPNDAQTLLDLRLKFPDLKEKTILQGRKITSLQLEITNWTKLSDNLRHQKTTLIDQNVNQHALLEDLQVWYKDPWIWFTVGLVSGIGTTVTIVYLVR